MQNLSSKKIGKFPNCFEILSLQFKQYGNFVKTWLPWNHDFSKLTFSWKPISVKSRFPWKHDFVKMNLVKTNFVKKRFREITISVQSHYYERGKNREIIFSVKSLTFLSCWLNREFPEKGNCRNCWLSSSKIKMSCLSWGCWSKRFHSIPPCTSSTILILLFLQ